MDSSPDLSDMTDRYWCNLKPKRIFQMCCVSTCFNNTFDTEKAFFTLPDDEDMLNKWLKIICREDLIEKPMANALVCEDHFKRESILYLHRDKILAKTGCPELYIPIPIPGYKRSTPMDDNNNSSQLARDLNAAPKILVDNATQTAKRALLLVFKREDDTKDCNSLQCRCKKWHYRILYTELAALSKFCGRIWSSSIVDRVGRGIRRHFACLFVIGMFGLLFGSVHLRICM